MDDPRAPTERYINQASVVGGEMLTWLTRSTDFWGNIASIGLAGGAELHTTVMPFILRGINLIGINSAAQLRDTRLVVWGRIAGDLRPRHLAKIAGHCIDLDALPVGASTATLVGPLGVHLTKTAETAYELMVLRSFAAALWHDLEAMAAEY